MLIISTILVIPLSSVSPGELKFTCLSLAPERDYSGDKLMIVVLVFIVTVLLEERSTGRPRAAPPSRAGAREGVNTPEMRTK